MFYWRANENNIASTEIFIPVSDENLDVMFKNTVVNNLVPIILNVCNDNLNNKN